MSEATGSGDSGLPATVLERIEQVCDRFEDAWRAGRRLRIEDELATFAGEGRSALLKALLTVELAYRGQHGERPTECEYRERFPDGTELVQSAFADLRWAARPPDGPRRGDGPRGSDGNLLFGILALQMDFLGRDDLIAAMNAWVLEKHRPLADILVDRGALSPGDRALLEPMVSRHIEVHGGEARRSLAALSSAGPVPDLRREIADEDVQASLGHVGTLPRDGDGDPGETTTIVGERATTGRFRILRFHARGGLGEVYVARDEELHREVALKRMRDEYADSPQHRARFVVEAEITAGLEHPGIVPVHGLGHHEDGRPFYAMRLIRGDNFKDAIARFHDARATGRDPGEQALELRRLLGRFLDVCNAIAYAHSRGVLHRDLKPGNIMLGRYGETLVVDWGLAKSVGRPGVERVDTERTLRPESGSEVEPTVDGERIGTPAYMSPEQAAGRLDLLGPASDVYSLGATLYYLLTGQPAFNATDRVELLGKIERGDYLRPRSVDALVDRGLEAICGKAMAVKPADRYPTPRELAGDIERWLADEPVTAYAEPIGGRLSRWARRHRAWAQAIAAALIALAAISSVAVAIVADSWRKAEAARKNEATERKKADLAASSERQQRDQTALALRASQLMSARMALDRGLALCERGRTDHGMIWLARALQLTPADSEAMSRTIRTNLGSRRDQLNSLRAVLAHPRGGVRDHAFSPDGKIVVTGGSDGTARLWDLATGRLLLPPLAHEGPVYRVRFRPDGKTLLTQSVDNNTRVWNPVTGELIGPPWKHSGRIRCVDFSPDGKTLAIGCENGDVQVWDLDVRTPIGKGFRFQQKVIRDIAFARGGKAILIVGLSEAELRDITSGERIGPLLLEKKEYKTLFAWSFSADGKAVALGGMYRLRGWFGLWDVASGKPLFPHRSESAPVAALAFRPDGNGLAICDDKRTVQVRELARGDPIGSRVNHQATVSVVAFSPDGEMLMTAGDDGIVRLWDAASGHPVGSPMKHLAQVNSANFCPDGRSVLTIAADGVPRLWDVAREPHDPHAHLVSTASIGAVAFSPDRRVAAISEWNTVRIRDVLTSREIIKPLEQFGIADLLTFSPDGRVLLTGWSHSKIVKPWNLTTGLPLDWTISNQDYFGAIAFRPDGKAIITGDRAGNIRFWDNVSGASLGAPLQHKGNVLALAVSRERNLLVTCAADRTSGSAGTIRFWKLAALEPIGESIRLGPGAAVAKVSPDGNAIVTPFGMYGAQVWAVPSGKPVGLPLKHQNHVRCFAFSADGKILATGSEDWTARLWDVATGAPLGPSLPHEDVVQAVIISPDGKTLVTGDGAARVSLWDVDTGRPLREPMGLHESVWALALQPEARMIVAVGRQGRIRAWPMPMPMAGEVDRIALQIQLLTNLRLDSADAIQVLELDQWQQIHRALETSGRPAP